MGPVDTDVRAHWRARYQSWSQPVIVLAGAMFLAGLSEVITNEGDTAAGRTLMGVSWFVFALDLALSWFLDADRRTFVRRRWPAFVAVLVPFLRALMVGYVFVRLAHGHDRLKRKFQLYTLYLTILVVTFGAVLVLAAERAYPGSNIHTYGEAVWWAAVTVTTVGYGDYVPVSPAGRAVATVMLLNGVAIISVFTATVSSRFVTDTAPGRAPVSLDELDDRLARIEDALARLAAADGSAPAAEPADDAAPPAGTAAGAPDSPA